MREQTFAEVVSVPNGSERATNVQSAALQAGLGLGWYAESPEVPSMALPDDGGDDGLYEDLSTRTPAEFEAPVDPIE